MSYRVVKTINGRQYLYEQETYREDGKVRTRSTYIGAIDPLTQPQSPPLKSDTATILQDGNTSPNTTIFSPKHEPVRLRIKAKVERHAINRAALQAEHMRFTRHIQALGLKTATMPKVIVGNGRRLAYRRRHTGSYTITLPRSGGSGTRQRTAFKRVYRRALAGAYLDMLQSQDPAYYAGLERNMLAAYKTQNKAIARYILHSGWKLSDRLGLTLHFMATKMLSDWSKANISSEKLGLADHDRRETWRSDAESVMAEVQQRGWGETYRKYFEELRRVETYTRHALENFRDAKLIDRMQGKRRQLRKTFRKLNARRAALYASCDKISVLAPLFQTYRDKAFDGRLPFTHNDKQASETKERGTR